MSKSSETLFPWVGNKKFYIEFIKSRLPKNWNDNHDSTYIEPFLGSGVVFSELKPERAILSDKSPYLIDIFKCMKSNAKYFNKKLKDLYEENNAELHAQCKNQICDTKSIYARSAMFWYLLRTSLYSFVCPKADGKSFICCYKSTGKPLSVKDKLYWEMSEVLMKENIQLFNHDFAEIIKMGNKGDFIFIDPPYMNLKRPSRKIYNSFSQNDHERLVSEILDADKRGCLIMLFNHKHPYLDEHLSNFNVVTVDHKQMRKSRSHFATYEEVMYTNY